MGPLRDSIDTRLSLERRREALTQEVAELHWDLGGLTYEMAIRDHFRLDVLVRRAAVLQERDAELAEVERLLSSPEELAGGALPGLLRLPHSRGAQFCWQCGERLMEELPSTFGEHSAERPVSRLPRPTLEGIRLPSRKVMAVLVLAFLGFGVLIGRAARNSVQQAALADAAAPLKVVVAPRVASPPIAAQAPAAEEAPPAEAAPNWRITRRNPWPPT